MSTFRRPRAAATAAAAGLAIGLTVVLAPSASASITPPTQPGALTIPDIHGTTFLSPYENQVVTGVPGIVTAVSSAGSSRGFWFQDPNGSPDPRSSAGLHVYTGSKTPAVAVGDSVLVSGTVDDYYPDAPPSRSIDLSSTELEKSVWTVVSSGNPLPKALVIRANSVPTRMSANAAGGSIEANNLRPNKYALDFYKSHESELIAVDNARVIGPTDAYGELYVTTKPNTDRTPRGGMIYPSYSDRDTGLLEITGLPTAGAPAFPEASVGDTLTGVTSGPLVYSQYGGYEIDASTIGTLRSGGIQPDVTRKQLPQELAIATYNVQNLAPTDPATKFSKLAQGIVHNLASPDIVAVEEVQDNDGETNDGVVAANVTLTDLTNAIVAAGGPRYDWREIDPVNDQDGGAPGGNIRQVFLFNPNRVSFVDVPGGTSTTPVQVLDQRGLPQLSASPGRIAPADPAWTASRKPLVGEFLFHGQNVFVVANHFVAKLADQPNEGRYQPPAQSSETQRQAQAQLVRNFVGDVQKIDPTANIVVVGDLNDYQFSPTAHILTSGGALRDLIDTLPRNQQYTYDYDGQSEVLDHILTSPSILWADYDPVHINAEFANQASDHDPQIVRIIPDDFRQLW
ncbi:MAG TPA: endonuclease/exonuclease/phosphatase family protein [Pseudonocardiaceae bacterium]